MLSLLAGASSTQSNSRQTAARPHRLHAVADDRGQSAVSESEDPSTSTSIVLAIDTNISPATSCATCASSGELNEVYAVDDVRDRVLVEQESVVTAAGK